MSKSEYNRGRLDIMADILNIVSKNESVNRTKIMSYANLSHDMLKQYLALLASQSMITEAVQINHRIEYKIMRRGRQFLDLYLSIKHLMAEGHFDGFMSKSMDDYLYDVQMVQRVSKTSS